MTDIYSYILAPYTTNNFAILQEAVAKYGDLTEESRIKTVYAKSEGDIIGEEGNLLTPADDSAFIYMKATTGELDFELLEGVTDYQIFTANTQPFNDYWL